VRDRLLIVDDDIGVRKQIYWGLRDRFEVVEAGDPESALASFQEFKPSVVTLDLRLSGPGSTDGMNLLRTMLVEDPSVRIIMVTADTDESSATRAMELGAWDYHTKPIVTSVLAEAAVRAARVRHLHEVARYSREVLVDATDFDTWLGTSDLARRVRQMLTGLATADAPVLIVGEPGTGRELAARALHEMGARPDTFFVQLDCANGLPDPATLPERATIFFDDVSALPESASVELGRWMSGAGERRVIASAPLEPSGQAAGNGDAVAYGYAGMLTALLPPLRSHPEDIPSIAERLLSLIGASITRRSVRLDPEARVALAEYRWPGNFRELEKRVLSAAVVTETETIHESDLWPTTASGSTLALKDNLARVERALVQRVLEANHGNVSRAARDLEVSRPTLHGLLRKHAIDPDAYRNGS
jgi:two-component system NtrC family response regulator